MVKERVQISKGVYVSIRKFPSATVPTLCMLILSSCSSKYPVDDDSCRFYGDTIWDKCWWFDNSGIFGIGIVGTIYFYGWKYIYDRDQKGKRGSTFGGFLYLLVGTPMAMMGALFLTMFFEKILTNP